MAADQSQRTEEPTPRRRQKARREGQVASSKDFTTAFQFAAAVLFLGVFGGVLGSDLMRLTSGALRAAFPGDALATRLP